MEQQTPRFYKRLRQCALRLQVLRLLAFMGLGLAFPAILILGMDALDSLFPMQERTAFYTGSVMILSFILLLIITFRRLHKSRPHPRSLAKRIETIHPELLDELNCSVELAEAENFRPTVIAASLLDKVEKDTAPLDFFKTVRTRLHSPLVLCALLITGFFLIHTGLKSKVSYKYVYYALATWGNLSGGISVSPRQPSVAVGTDLTVTAEIFRWEKEAEITVFKEGSRETYPMMIGSAGVLDFTFYNVNEPFFFRIKTPSLTSPEIAVRTYVPPEVKTAVVHILPPDYSRMPEVTVDGLNDLEVLAGSTVLFQITAQADRLDFMAGNKEFAVENIENKMWRLKYQPPESIDYQFRLTSRQGHKNTTPSRKLELYKDEPPVVEIIQPGKDINLPPDTDLQLEIYAADDFGLSQGQLIVTVSGDRNQIFNLDLPQDKKLPVKETEIGWHLRLNEIGAQDGDVVAYYAIVADNLPGEPQKSLSDIFFIEIREDIEPEQSDKTETKEKKKVNLRALIIELKRLIRESHKTLIKPDDIQKEKNVQIAADLHTVRQKLAEITPEIGPTLEPQLNRRLEDALMQTEQAEMLINKNFTGESVQLQQQALANLVYVANSLRKKNIISQGPGQEYQKATETDEDKKQAKKQDNKETLRSEFLNLLTIKERLEHMIDQQGNLNLRMERAVQTKASSLHLEQLGGKQESIAQETNEIVNQMEDVNDFNFATGQAQFAEQKMIDAGGALAKHDAESGWRKGLEAREFLMQAATMTDDRMGFAASEMIRRLARKTQELALRQEEIGAKSHKAARSGAMEKPETSSLQQQQLQESLKELLEQLELEAADLSQGFREAANDLYETRRQANRSGTVNQMSKAINALLYERYKRAARAQDNAAEGLAQLARDINDVQGKLPAVTIAQMERYLTNMKQEQQSLKQLASEGEASRLLHLERLSSMWSDRFRRLGEALPNKRYTEMSRELSELDAGSFAQQSKFLEEMFEQASGMLSVYLANKWRQKQLIINRRAAPPPDEYRKQVEEYFKNLANER